MTDWTPKEGWIGNPEPKEDPKFLGIGWFAWMLIFAVILVIAILSFADYGDDDLGDPTPYNPSTPSSDVVYVEVHNNAASGYVDLHVNGAYKRTVYIRNGGSDRFEFKSTSSVTFSAYHEDGFYDSDTASPGRWANLYLG